ncbi:DUF3592 domain-containing protein [Corallococcus aberystwythensis]|uniref:DUF3592 domain-containing protein n=1 Tax=Corallococcus aberystwythensis TaxID=2316722 RepID=A0A3A8PCS4_9BACT|nr:DUF3592 domain-containing protein [Corallococcus aberystwythensis]RKH53759.1 DUF3592 domain-containing protein [Corallococcus aberystwythensis]
MHVLNFVWVGVFFVALPLTVLCSVWRAYRVARKLRERGLRAQGTLVRVKHGSIDGYTYWDVDYVFHPPGGPEVRGSYQHPEKEARPIPRQGDPVEVRYLPDNPRWNQVEGDETALSTRVLLTAIFLTVLGIVAFGLVRQLN